LEHSKPYDAPTDYNRDARGMLAKLRISSSLEIFPSGVRDEYIAYSSANVFRGFHRQIDPHDGVKVFFVISGNIELYTLDASQVTEGNHLIEKHIMCEAGQALVVPRGYFTGYLVKSEQAIVMVKSSSSYAPSFQMVISPNEVWPNAVTRDWLLSDQDKGTHA